MMAALDQARLFREMAVQIQGDFSFLRCYWAFIPEL
jgi:hypothetical protein